MKIKGKTRKHYEKPQVSQVKLEVEEAVLAACKNPTTLGKNVVGCRSGTSSCQSIWTGS